MKIINKLIIVIVLFFQISTLYSNENEKIIPLRILGNSDAKIIIEEYASMSCGHCASFHNKYLSEIREKYIDTGKAKLIFNDFPLDRSAMFGSMVSQCMNDKQFFPVISRLFQKQLEWVQSDDIVQAIYKVLKPLGIKEEKIISCLENTEINKKRWDNLLEARKFAMDKKNVESTPTFFINGQKVEGKFDINTLNETLK